MTRGIVGRIIKFDTELLRKGYVRVEGVGGGGGGGCIQVTKAGSHLRHFLGTIKSHTINGPIINNDNNNNNKISMCNQMVTSEIRE